MSHDSDFDRHLRALDGRIGRFDHFAARGLSLPERVALLCQVRVSDALGTRYDWFHGDQEQAGGLCIGSEALETFQANCLLIAAGFEEQGDRVQEVVFHVLPVGQGAVVELVNPTSGRIPAGSFGITVDMESWDDERLGPRRAPLLFVPEQRGVSGNCYAVVDWYQLGAVHFDAVRQVFLPGRRGAPLLPGDDSGADALYPAGRAAGGVQ
jgi:hypothetical protein